MESGTDHCVYIGGTRHSSKPKQHRDHPQKYGIKDLFSGMLWIPAAFRQSLHSGREIKHLIEVGLELVSAQD
jgi:hypothetical protein